MNAEKLERMTKKIAAVFRACHGQEACASTHDHIMLSSTPNMRGHFLPKRVAPEPGSIHWSNSLPSQLGRKSRTPGRELRH
jgi:hypothetical protein